MSAFKQLGLTTPWRLLGASAGLTYTSLGLWQILAPASALPALFAIPATTTVTRRGASPPGAAASARQEQADAEELPNETGLYLVPLSGARELSLGASILGLFYARSFREAGLVVSASLILVVVDVVKCWKKWDAGV